MYCNDCPRKCNAYRDTKRGKGFCKSGIYPVVAKAYLHKWEEPCISGQNGAGNIFFCGCNLKCCYCQNKEISGISSQDTHCGRQITPERLSEIYDELIKKGAHCINLVTPTHYSAGILKSLELHGKLSVPLVYNCSGYETEESLKLFDNKVDIYMPDMKYGINSVAEKYSNAYDYPEIAKNAIREMFRQTGPYEYDESGMLKKGVIIRHLMLPGNLRNTFSVIDWVNETFKTGDILFSLMSQYTPVNDTKYKELGRKITEYEYNKAVDYLFNTDITNVFLQELSSADDSFIPDFNLEGID